MPCSSGDFQLKTMFGVGKIHLLRFGCMLCHFYPGGFTCLKHHLWSVNSHVESKTAIEESKTLGMMSLNQSFQPALIIAEFAENSAPFRKKQQIDTHWHWKKVNLLRACHHHEEFKLLGTASTLLIHISKTVSCYHLQRSPYLMDSADFLAQSFQFVWWHRNAIWKTFKLAHAFFDSPHIM